MGGRISPPCGLLVQRLGMYLSKKSLGKGRAAKAQVCLGIDPTGAQHCFVDESRMTARPKKSLSEFNIP